jgi:hypothetical protein
MMHRYQVVERWPEEDRCALRCSRGRLHLVRALKLIPPVGTTLFGDKPHLGFGMLECARSATIYRVIFESINELRIEPKVER